MLIIGGGVFGLSTAFALARRPEWSGTKITLVDRASCIPADAESSGPTVPSRDAASIDSSRIVRADYNHPAYAALAAQAQAAWRGDESVSGFTPGPGSDGGSIYHEVGLVLVANDPDTSVQDDVSPADRPKARGMDYVRASWENALALSRQEFSSSSPEQPISASGTTNAGLTLLPSQDAIASHLSPVGLAAPDASWGYVNRQSGWVDAAAAMARLLSLVRATGRVEIVAGEVEELTWCDSGDDGCGRVTGARLADGTTLAADLTIVAAGAWTPRLVDLRGRVAATGQCMAYVEVRPGSELEERVRGAPVVLNLTTGLFVIPPPPLGNGDKDGHDGTETGGSRPPGVLKVARHAYGYLNPTAVSPAPLAPTPEEQRRVRQQHQVQSIVSLPRTAASDPPVSRLPAEGLRALRDGLKAMVPSVACEESEGSATASTAATTTTATPYFFDISPFVSTRLCWYADTPHGHWLVGRHPGWDGLFVATGDSGHAFKFLPVLGERVLDVLEHEHGKAASNDALVAELASKWRFKDPVEGFGWPAAAGVAGNDQHGNECRIGTEDGSRSGRPGLLLAEELKTAVS